VWDLQHRLSSVIAEKNKKVWESEKEFGFCFALLVWKDSYGKVWRRGIREVGNVYHIYFTHGKRVEGDIYVLLLRTPFYQVVKRAYNGPHWLSLGLRCYCAVPSSFTYFNLITVSFFSSPDSTQSSHSDGGVVAVCEIRIQKWQ